MNKVEKKEKDDVMMKKKNIRQTDNVVKIELLKQRLKSIYLGTRWNDVKIKNEMEQEKCGTKISRWRTRKKAENVQDRNREI